MSDIETELFKLMVEISETGLPPTIHEIESPSDGYHLGILTAVLLIKRRIDGLSEEKAEETENAPSDS